MRKRVVVFALALSLLLAGCAGETGGTGFDTAQPMPGYDAQNQYMLSNAISFQEADGFFCGTGSIGNLLYYYDKASGISGILCTDPACAHDDAACGGHVESGANLSCYDGALYWVAEDPQGASGDKYLWRDDLSGNGRERVKPISFEHVVLPYQPQRYVIHRGRLYLLGRADTVGADGVSAATRVSLLSASLDGGEAFTALYDQTLDAWTDATVRFVGNAAYLCLVSVTPEERRDVTVLRCGLTDGSCETLYTATGLEMVPGALWVTEEGEVYLPVANDEAQFLWRLEDGSAAEAAAWSGDGSLDVTGGIAVRTSLADGVRLVQITDLSGQVLYDGPLLPQGIPGVEMGSDLWGLMIVGGDEDKLIVNLSLPSEEYTLMLDLNHELEPTVLWGGQR